MMNRWIFTLGLCCALFSASTGHLNIYLNLYEVIRLLGVSAELYYVRDGLINDYAFNFAVPVPANIQEITFTWQSLTRKPLPYSINIATSDPDVLPRPTLNISKIGEIPTQIQTFAVGMKCSGTRAAQVDVNIRIEIILNKSTNNITELLFRRKKMCQMTVTEPPVVPRQLPPPVQLPPVQQLPPVEVDPDHELDDPLQPENMIPPRSEITALMIGGVLALVLISILISIAFCGRSSSKPQNNGSGSGSQLVKTSSFQHLQNPTGYALKSIYSSPSDAIIGPTNFGTHRDYNLVANGGGGGGGGGIGLNGNGTIGGGCSANNTLLNNHHHHSANNTMNHPLHHTTSLFSESIHYSSGTLGGYLRPPIRLPTSGHYNQCSDFGDSYYMSIDERI